jgi:hypothetical protein
MAPLISINPRPFNRTSRAEAAFYCSSACYREALTQDLMRSARSQDTKLEPQARIRTRYLSLTRRLRIHMCFKGIVSGADGWIRTNGVSSLRERCIRPALPRQRVVLHTTAVIRAVMFVIADNWRGGTPVICPRSFRPPCLTTQPLSQSIGPGAWFRSTFSRLSAECTSHCTTPG